MISEGTIFVTDDRGQHEVQLEWFVANADMWELACVGDGLLRCSALV